MEAEQQGPLKAGQWLCPHCVGSLVAQCADGQNVLYGVARRGMSDCAPVCPNCKKSCVLLLGISDISQLRAVYGDKDGKELLKNSNFRVLGSQ